MAVSKFFKSYGGKSAFAALSKVLFRHMPRWLMKMVLIKMVSARPQLSYLSLVEDIGSSKPIYQPSLHKTLAIHKTRATREPENSHPMSQLPFEETPLCRRKALIGAPEGRPTRSIDLNTYFFCFFFLSLSLEREGA